MVCRAIPEGIDGGERVVRIDIRKLCGLLEAQAAAVPPGTRRQLVAMPTRRGGPGCLPRQPVIILLCEAVDDDAVTLLYRLRL